MREDFLWVEKYRPHKIEDCVLPANLKDTFQKFVDDTNIAANLLLKQKNSQEFTRKYGANVNNASLLHQN